mmetsp:Transcript_13360/g.35500  ORF Transcript_13360/g.35500 Transcript_13360/m.35500 type:complete len:215 (+) Transcript_13360:419-1063(+)
MISLTVLLVCIPFCCIVISCPSSPWPPDAAAPASSTFADVPWVSFKHSATITSNVVPWGTVLMSDNRVASSNARIQFQTSENVQVLKRSICVIKRPGCVMIRHFLSFVVSHAGSSDAGNAGAGGGDTGSSDAFSSDAPASCADAVAWAGAVPIVTPWNCCVAPLTSTRSAGLVSCSLTSQAAFSLVVPLFLLRRLSLSGLSLSLKSAGVFPGLL